MKEKYNYLKKKEADIIKRESTLKEKENLVAKRKAELKEREERLRALEKSIEE